VTPEDSSTAEAHTIGLCATCIHVQRIQSDRGSLFFLCQLALTDHHFRKYPRLPVLKCEGYQASESKE